MMYVTKVKLEPKTRAITGLFKCHKKFDIIVNEITSYRPADAGPSISDAAKAFSVRRKP